MLFREQNNALLEVTLKLASINIKLKHKLRAANLKEAEIADSLESDIDFNNELSTYSYVSYNLLMQMFLAYANTSANNVLSNATTGLRRLR